MTVTDNSRRAFVYGEMADRPYRDPIQDPAHTNRATVPMGRGFMMWRRFNLAADLVSVHDDKGREWFLTPKQAAVYDLARTYIENGTTRIRSMALELGFSPSTVSRALVKLQAIGLLAVVVGRGCYGGVIVIGRAANDGLERFREVAKAKLRAWRKAAEDRVSRLKNNVATYYPWKTIEDHGYGNVYGDVMVATLKREWAWDEIEDALRS